MRNAAEALILDGWGVVAVNPGEKRASTSWQKRTYAPDDFKTNDNLAVKCGEPSGWRVDVDCDAQEAIAAARDLLPRTELVHGRPSKPDSHYWFHCEGIKTTQFTDVKDSSGKTAMLIEIRSTGGYTLVPPSTHPSQEVLAWSVQRGPMTIAPDALYEAVRNVAIAALVARHWPSSGARHAATGHLAGFLVQAGLDEAAIVRIILTAARIAGDTDLRDREAFARSTCDKFKNDPSARLTGGPRLAESLGEGVVAKLRAWLRVADTDAIEDEPAPFLDATRKGRCDRA
jgi:hypothetical protein